MAEGLLFDPRVKEFVYRVFEPKSKQVAKEFVAGYIPETTREVTTDDS